MNQQNRHHEDQPVIIAPGYLVINGSLHQHRPQWHQGCQQNGEQNQEIKWLLIGLDKLKEHFEHFEVYNIATFNIFFFQWNRRKVSTKV